MKLLKAELAGIFRDKKLLIPIVAVLFVPILYAGMFLWAFWDPYERLDELPVAIVNEDMGAQFEETELLLGDELVTKLNEAQEFEFHFVSKDEAVKGLEEQKYYMLVEIPKDFSENATTLMDENPKKLDLMYVPNESYNFLSSQIGETAVLKIQTALQEKITEIYAETIFDKMTELADGISDASDGAGKVDDAVSELAEGSDELRDNLLLLAKESITFNDGVGKMNSGSSEAEAGASDLSQGLGELATGHSEIQQSFGKLVEANDELSAGISDTRAGLSQASSSIPAIVSGTEQLTEGSQALADGLHLWNEKATEASIGAGRVNGGIVQLNKQLEQVLPILPEEQQMLLKGALAELEEGSRGVADGIKGLADSASTVSQQASHLSTQLATVNEGQKSLQLGIGKLATGAAQLESGSQAIGAGQRQFSEATLFFNQKINEASKGSKQLIGGMSELSNGTQQLADGSGALVDSVSQLADGSEKLSAGTSELLDGSTELASELAGGAEEASVVKSDDDTYQMMAKPVEVTEEKLNEVPNYGTGFAPYFLSLGLFVGALLLSIVFPLTEPMAVPKSGLNWFTSKFAILAGIGVIQALLAVAILLFGLKLEVQSIPLFILFAIITSVTFIALIQFLVTLFDNPGRFVAIIILIMQLTTSAGTFPLELVPNVLQPFNALFPMTYTVQGLKAVISSGDMTYMWQNVAVLFGFTVVCVLGTLGYFSYKHKRKFATMQKSAA